MALTRSEIQANIDATNKATERYKADLALIRKLKRARDKCEKARKALLASRDEARVLLHMIAPICEQSFPDDDGEYPAPSNVISLEQARYNEFWSDPCWSDPVFNESLKVSSA